MESNVMGEAAIQTISTGLDPGRTTREAFAAGEEAASVYPRVIYIETTNVCNLRCPMCPVTLDTEGYNRPEKFFDLAFLDSLEPFLRRAERCFMNGGGEPFLHKQFFELVERVKATDTEVLFNSHGMFIDEEKAEKLIGLEVDCITISIDGATPESYERIRINGDLARVKKNLVHLRRAKERAGTLRPLINMQMTLSKPNVADIVPMVDLAHECGVQHMVIEPLTPVFGFDPQYQKYFDENYVPYRTIRWKLKRAARRAKKKGILFTSHYFADFPAPTTDIGRCPQPWLNFGVRVNGDVFPCCGTEEVMGSLRDHSAEDIWNGAGYRALRRSIAAGEYPDICRLCISENRASHYNEDLVKY